MNVFYGLIILLVLGFIGSYLTGQTKRFSLEFQSVLTLGGGFLFLGLMLGPQVSGVLSETALQELSPVISLGLGWMGLLVGLQFDGKLMRQIATEIKQQTFLISMITIFIVCIGLYGMGILQSSTVPFSLGFCLCLACAASLSDYSVMALFRNVDSARGGVVKQIQLLSDMRVPLAIVIMALWYGVEAVFQHHVVIENQNSTVFYWQQIGFYGLYYCLEVLLWFFIAVVLGFSLGCLLHYLTSERLQPNEMLLIITGTVVLSSGLAMYIHTSPLFVNFVLGLTLTNLPNFARGRLSNRLLQTERPFFTVFMIFVGALWIPQHWYALYFVAGYIMIRMIGLFIGVIITQHTVTRGGGAHQPLYLGMISQGGTALAIVVDYYLIQTHQLTGQSYFGSPDGILQESLSMLALHIMILSMVIHQIIGASSLRYFLRRYGAVKPVHKQGSNQNPPSPTEVKL